MPAFVPINPTVYVLDSALLPCSLQPSVRFAHSFEQLLACSSVQPLQPLQACGGRGCESSMQQHLHRQRALDEQAAARRAALRPQRLACGLSNLDTVKTLKGRPARPPRLNCAGDVTADRGTLRERSPPAARPSATSSCRATTRPGSRRRTAPTASATPWRNCERARRWPRTAGAARRRRS